MILIFGCGFLGTHLIPALRNLSAEPIIATTRSQTFSVSMPHVEHLTCDITDEADLAALAYRCKGEHLTVFYFAACHNIDYIFEHPLEAVAINIDGLQRFLQTVDNIDKLFFASTDCVYGENSDAYPTFSEAAPLTPVNVYGEQKAAAEQIIRQAGFTCVRFGYMLGASLTSKKHFYDKLIADLRCGKPVEMIDGMTRSVLSYTAAADLLARLSDLPKPFLPEVVNLCGDEGLTKYEMGLRIARAAGYSTDLIRSINEAQGQKFFKDRRASSAVMDNGRLKTLLEIDRILWDPMH